MSARVKILVKESASEGKMRVSRQSELLEKNVSAVSMILARFRSTMCAMTAIQKGRFLRMIWSLFIAR